MRSSRGSQDDAVGRWHGLRPERRQAEAILETVVEAPETEEQRALVRAWVDFTAEAGNGFQAVEISPMARSCNLALRRVRLTLYDAY